MLHWAEYEQFTAGEAAEAQPLVRAVVQVGPRRRKALALIDSGSGMSFIPRFIAEDLGCLPLRYDHVVQQGVSSFAAGDVMAQAQLLLSKNVLGLPLSVFMVPAPGADLPFVILGSEPLLEAVEVRFRGWEGRIGFRERPRPWVLPGTSANGRRADAPS